MFTKITLKMGQIVGRQTDGQLKDCLTASFFNIFIQSVRGPEPKNAYANACVSWFTFALSI
jgi:hypothetical protein